MHRFQHYRQCQALKASLSIMFIHTVKEFLAILMAIYTFSFLVSYLYLKLFNLTTRKNIEFIFFLDFDQSIKDMKKHNFTSMVLSEYQNGVCKEKKLDPEDVLCARLTISGSLTTVTIKTVFPQHF